MVSVLLLFLAFTVTAPPQIPAPAKPAPPAAPAPESVDVTKPTAESLLQQAHVMARELPPTDRAQFIVDAIGLAQQVQPALVRPWAEELFALAPEVPVERRAFLEGMAIRPLATLDPEFALSLLERMEPPPLRNMVFSLAPVREVFQGYWARKHARGLDRLREVAAHIGANDMYPYAAFSGILVALRSEDPAAGEALFAALIATFRGRSPDYAETAAFAALLRSGDWLSSSAMGAEALHLAVAAIDGLRADSLPQVRSRMTSTTETTEINDARAYLLLPLLPYIRKVDPGWADSVVSAHPGLAPFENSDRHFTSTSTSFSAAPTTSSQAPARTPPALSAVARGRRDVAQVQMLAQYSPLSASRYLTQVSDPAARAAASAEIAGAMGAARTQQADAYWEQATKGLEQVDDPAAKLMVIAALARAAYARRDLATAGSYVDRGYTLGEELMRKDYNEHPDKPTNTLAGSGDVWSLTRTAILFDPAGTLARITTVRFPTLRVNLMLAAAQSVHDGAAPPVKQIPDADILSGKVEVLPMDPQNPGRGVRVQSKQPPPQ